MLTYFRIEERAAPTLPLSLENTYPLAHVAAGNIYAKPHMHQPNFILFPLSAGPERDRLRVI